MMFDTRWCCTPPPIDQVTMTCIPQPACVGSAYIIQATISFWIPQTRCIHHKQLSNRLCVWFMLFININTRIDFGVNTNSTIRLRSNLSLIMKYVFSLKVNSHPSGWNFDSGINHNLYRIPFFKPHKAYLFFRNNLPLSLRSPLYRSLPLYKWIEWIYEFTKNDYLLKAY